MRRPLTIAVAQPACVAHDVWANAHAHADAVRTAQARVVAFPELSLTGYELDAAAISLDDDALTPIVTACAATGAVALVGAPVAGRNGRDHIATVRIGAHGADVAYRKCHLGGDEPARFSAGDGPATLEIDGWRIGLGICKDTGVADHVRATAALGMDVYVAGLVDQPAELPEQVARAASIARECTAYVAFASFAGPTGGGYGRTAGSSAIWSPDGAVIARAGAAAGEVARATIR